MMKKLAVPYVTETDRTPAVMKLLAWSEGLLEIIHRVQEENGHLRDEVAVLKGEKKRPTFKPSRMNEEAGKAAEPDRMQNGKPAKRRGSEKKSKTSQLEIDCDEVIEPAETIPPGSRFKGYRDFRGPGLGDRITQYAISIGTLGNAGRSDPGRPTSAGSPRRAFRPDAGKLCALSVPPLSRHAAAAVRATSAMGHRDLVGTGERATASGQGALSRGKRRAVIERPGALGVCDGR